MTEAYVLRAAVEGWEPYTLILSDSAGQANELLRHIRVELEANQQLAAIYPGSTGAGPEWKENRLRLRNGAVIEALGTGSKIRGRRNRSARPSLMIFDDVQSNEDVTSAVMRERAWRWASREVIPAGDEDTTFLSVGSALHRDAVAVKLGTLPGWTGTTFPAIHEWPVRTDLWTEFDRLASNLVDMDRAETAGKFYATSRAEMDRGARWYWPGRLSLADVMLKRAEIGPDAFDAEYQGRPGSGAGAEWPPEYFDWPGMWFDDWPADLVYRVQSLDPSKGEDRKHGDFQAHVMLGVDPRGDLWAEGVLNQEVVPQMVARAITLANIHGLGTLDQLTVENNDSLGMVYPEFERQLAELGAVYPVIPVMQHQNKVVRISRLGLYFGRHRVRFRNTSSTRLLVDQLRDFPTGDHDDGPDALELAVRTIEELTNPRGRR